MSTRAEDLAACRRCGVVRRVRKGVARRPASLCRDCLTAELLPCPDCGRLCSVYKIGMHMARHIYQEPTT